ncbi:MAG: hypothetical protein WC760_09050 [Bacteroidia bacterium]|jgi:hypothetical protein
MKTGLFFLVTLFSLVCYGQQRPDSLTYDSLHDAEIRLIGLGTNMIQSGDESMRLFNGRSFLITLSRALRIKNSYFYRFDSLNCASILYSPDDAFRIITWNVVLNNETFHYFGVIQLNPVFMKSIKDTSNLRSVYPLIDRSSQIRNPMDTTLGPEFWYGANYYQIIPVMNKGKKAYTLLGWNGSTMMTNKKIVDYLFFDLNRPRFGAPVFDLKDPRYKRLPSRLIFEFSNQATMTLKYSVKKKFLIYESMVPPRPQDYGHPETYLPDGSFDYLIYKKGIWEKQSGALRDFDLE